MLQRGEEDEKLNVYCSMTLTMRWLVPCLGRFHARHPRREICMHTPIPEARHLRAGRLAVAVRMGYSDWEETTNEKLFDIKLVPVCSPALLQRHPLSKDLTDLKRLPLLHSLMRAQDWDNWARAANADIAGHTQLQFESSSLAYEAALGGLGVAMGQLALVQDDLLRGRLVIPFPLLHCDTSWVSLCARREVVRSQSYLEFRRWIRDEAKRVIEEERSFCAANNVSLI